MEMERVREDILHSHAMEKEDLVTSMGRMKDELNNEINMLQRDRDDSLLLAENEKQQVWQPSWKFVVNSIVVF